MFAGKSDIGCVSVTGRISIYEQGSIIGNRSLCGHFINTLL
jgi:hypothetical protein